MTQHPIRHKRTLLAAMGVIAVTAGLLTGTQNFAPAPAYALDLPTWDDVQQAKSNQAAADKKVAEIEALIKQVQQDVESTKTTADAARVVLASAEFDFQDASKRFEELSTAAEESKATAQETSEQAAVLASQMYRTAGVDQNIELLLDADGETADVLLEKLAMMSKATERSTTLYEEARQAQNNASSLSQQADVAKGEREELRDDYQQKMDVAASAAQEASTRLTESEEQEKLLQAQLDALKDTTATTVDGYEERLRLEEIERQRILEEQRKAAEAEARRLQKLAEEAAKRAAEEAANSGGGGGGGGGGPVAVVPPASGGGGGGGGGWVRPSGGYLSSHYSWDRPACNNGYCSYAHTGTDLAANYGTAIVAATSGTVSLSGWVGGGGGNMVYINHADGVQTRYAHLSSIYVGPGQYVSAGQVIGLAGATGNANGPHLHFEVLVGGSFVDPYYFMGNRGVWF